MIITNSIKLKISPPNINWYKSKLSDDIKVGDIVEIEVNLLPKNSNIKVEVSCDICNNKKMCIYGAYNRYISNSPDGLYRCIKCNDTLRKKTLKEKYGDENYTNVDKYKETMFNRYGGHCNKLDFFKEKIKKSCYLKNGVYYPLQSNEIMYKYNKTMIEKYGYEYPLLNDIIKDKAKKTMVVKYGKEYSMQVDFIKNKIIKSSNLSKIEKIKNSNYEIIKIDYDKNNYECLCDVCKEIYTITPHMFSMRKKHKTVICTKCNSIKNKYSGYESILYEFILENYEGDVIKSWRDVFEIDIYLPQLKIGFEFNGLYWHSEKYKDNNYHLNKTNFFKERGIQIIHIWEDDWLYKEDIVKSMILNKIGKVRRIFARNCQVITLSDNKLVKDFLDKNHLQGFVGSKVKVGLIHNGELVSLMTFGSLRKSLGQISKNDVYELLRFCSKINISVVGGASKLFKYFINNYNPIQIISYSDNSRGVGILYNKLGFKLEHQTNPNYYWIIDGVRRHRYNYRKDKLVKDGHDSNKTEIEIMTELGYYRIFDCGSNKFTYNL